MRNGRVARHNNGTMVFEPNSRPKMTYSTNTNTRDTEADVAKVLDDALEKLRWARAHVQEQKAPIELRELAARMGYLAQALTYEMDGQPSKADVSISLAQGVSRRQQEALRQAWEDMWWSH
jgi:Asp-tRNA(Asn)/Glu-tRNA(Gln) amidotransferase A subunit family amidase